MIAGPRAALRLLTILPVGGGADGAPRSAPAWFPFAGAVVGGIAAGVYALVEPGLGGPFAAALSLAAAAVATGGLHHDGLADTFDGLGVRADLQRRLEVMRDPRIGTFGTLALVAWWLLAVLALARLDRGDACAALFAAHVLSRCGPLVQLAWVKAARPDGLGAGFVAGPPAVAVASAAATIAAALACGVGAGLLALTAAAAAALCCAVAARAWFGGRTGDTLGASVLVAELGVYVALAAFWASAA